MMDMSPVPSPDEPPRPSDLGNTRTVALGVSACDLRVLAWSSVSRTLVGNVVESVNVRKGMSISSRTCAKRAERGASASKTLVWLRPSGRRN